VWQRSLELAGTGSHLHLPDHALALARTAGHDADTMAHALGLGRSQARHPSTGEPALRGVRLLERAIGYLGVRSSRDDLGTDADTVEPPWKPASSLGPSSSGTSPLLSRHEEATMPGPGELWTGDDDLSRQRRKREARVLDGQVPDFPGLTVADVVADVLAASDDGRAVFDVPHYLVEQGHTSMTIRSVVDYLRRSRPSFRGSGPPAPAERDG
jgi:hypothetical protein